MSFHEQFQIDGRPFLLLATRLCIIVIVITVLCTFRLKVVFNSYGIILSVRASLCQRYIICQNVTNPGSLFHGIQPHYETDDI